MPIIADLFSASGYFNAVWLTAAVNVQPNAYTRIEEIGIFGPGEGIPTTSVAVEFANGVLNLLPTRVRGGTPSLGLPLTRNARNFATFHIPHEDFVHAEDVQNRIARFGEQTGLESVASLIVEKLARMRRKHDVTLEHLRATALRGTVLDYDGSTLLNLFTEFGVTEKVVDFVLGTPTTDVLAKLREVSDHIEDNLMGETSSSVRGLASPEWFAKFRGHAKVVEAWKYAQPLPGGPAGNPFFSNLKQIELGGVIIEEYRGTVSQVNEDGTTTARRLIPAGDVRFFPMGTADTFTTYFAPPNFINEANTAPGGAGARVFAVTGMDNEFQGNPRWARLHTQSNPLPMVKRPALLVRGHSSN